MNRRILVAGLTALLLTSALAVFYASGVSAQEYPTTVSTSEDSYATSYNHARKLVRLSDGTLYCVYFKQLAGQYQIYAKRSADNGQNWTNETRISTYNGMGDYDQFSPSIAVDSGDCLHVVWHGKAAGFTTVKQVWYAKYTASWAEPARISTHDGMDDYDQFLSSIAVDSSGCLHVVWMGKAAGFTTTDQIWYTEYTGSWVTPVRISTYDGMNTLFQWFPSIAVDSSDYPHVVWYGYASGYTTGSQIWHTKYTDSWATPSRISTYPGMVSHDQDVPSIAVDSNDNLHIVWHGMATGYTDSDQIWYAKYTTDWAEPVRISTYDGMDTVFYYQMYPSISVDSGDYLHVVWHGKATGYTDYDKVWYAKHVTGWATPEVKQATGQNMFPNARWSRWPAGNIPTDRLDYVFTEGTSSPYSVKFDYLFLGTPPNAPTSLLCGGQTNPTHIIDLTPEFSAIGTDSEGDQMDYCALQVDDDIYFGSPIWNKTKTSITAFDNGTRCEDIIYAGSSLVRGTTYYWRIKFWDVKGMEGDWSVETATFQLNRLPAVPTNFTDLGMNLIDHTPTITWTKGTDGDGDTVITYIYLGTTSTPTEMEASTTGEGLILGENVSHSCYPLTDGSVYYYRLRSWDGYEWSTSYTTADEFRMNSLPSAGVVSPEHGAEDVWITPILDWSFSDGEGDPQTKYWVMVDNDSDFSSPVVDTDLVSSDNTHYAITTLLDYETTYYWAVRVYDGYELSAPPPVWHFTTVHYGPVMWEHYNTGDDSWSVVFDTFWRAQTFTTGGVDHTVTSIRVKIYKSWDGSWPGTCYISIRATDEDGHPTGGDLTGASFDGHLIDDYPGAWYEFYVPENTLSAGTKYAIVLRAPAGSGAKRIEWGVDHTDPAYDGGNVEESSDSGSSWAAITGSDFMFEIWSTPFLPEWTEVEVWTDYCEITGWNTVEVWTDYFYYSPVPDIEVLLALLSMGVIVGLGLVGFNASKERDPVPGIFMMSAGVLFTWWIGWLPSWILITSIALIAVLGAVLWGKIFRGGGG